MAFQFVPNADGGFTEGDKQTNPESGVEYIYHDGAWRHLGAKIEDEFDTLDERYLPLTGGVLSGVLHFQRENEGNPKTAPSFRITPNSGDFSTNVYVMSGGQLRLRSSHTEFEGDHKGSHIVLSASADGSNPTTKIYKVPTPTSSDMAASKAYVDSVSGGVPVGSIMMWINATAPAGWFKCKGSTFDIAKYPLLHAYLQQSDGYVSGKLPDWRGHYPGQLGDHLNGDVGSKHGQRTAKPSGGAPKSTHQFNDGSQDTANKAGGTHFADVDTQQVVIDSGWDSVTRPKTVAVHFIIKHD